jgi:hypothetical protein
MPKAQNLCLLGDISCKHSYLYLRTLLKNGVVPKGIILLNFSVPSFKIEPNIWKILAQSLEFKAIKNLIIKYKFYGVALWYRIRLSSVKLESFEEKKLVLEMHNFENCAFIYTCGGRVPKSFFEDYKFRILHCHIGYIPDFRGSDCLTWSALIDGKIGASIFYMTENLDRGDLISRMKMPLISIPRSRLFFWDSPKSLQYLDKRMDPLIRAIFLSMTLKEYQGKDYRNLPVRAVEDKQNYDFLWVHPKTRKIINNLLRDKVAVISKNCNLATLMKVDD